MKINESVTHYIGLLGGFAILLLVTFSGWELADQSVWFDELWDSMPNRLFIIFVGTLSIIGTLAYTYSYFWGHKKFIRTFKEVGILKLEACQDNELVRIQGKLILLGNPLIAPYSGTQCAAYETRASTLEEVVTVSGGGSNVQSKPIWETLKLVQKQLTF